MRVIGITGGVGAGKSTVLSMLLELCKCRIIMADDVAKNMMEYHGNLSGDIIRIFGSEAYEDGILNRAHIASLMYGDSRLMEEWTSIIHPAVNKEIAEYIKKEKNNGEVDFVFIESALLIEHNYEKICDELWYVFADADTRIERLKMQRGYSREKSESIIAKQLSDEMFREKCNFVIDTSKDLSFTRSIIKNKLAEYV